MQLIKSKNKVIFLEGAEFIRNFRRDFCSLKSIGNQSIYSKETSLAIVDIFDAAERMYLGELAMQQAVDQVLSRHYKRTKDWDRLSQEIANSVIQPLIVKFFGKPLKKSQY